MFSSGESALQLPTAELNCQGTRTLCCGARFVFFICGIPELHVGMPLRRHAEKLQNLAFFVWLCIWADKSVEAAVFHTMGRISDMGRMLSGHSGLLSTAR